MRASCIALALVVCFVATQVAAQSQKGCTVFAQFEFILKCLNRSSLHDLKAERLVALAAIVHAALSLRL